MKNILFSFDKMSETDRNIKTIKSQFLKLGVNIIDVAQSAVKRTNGISYKELMFTLSDSQQIGVRVKQTGDIFQVLLNKKVLPIKDQDNHEAAIKEIAGKVDAGRAAFQKKLAATKIEIPKGITSTVPKTESALVEKRDALKEAIAEADVQIADLQQKIDARKAPVSKEEAQAEKLEDAALKAVTEAPPASAEDVLEEKKQDDYASNLEEINKTNLNGDSGPAVKQAIAHLKSAIKESEIRNVAAMVEEFSKFFHISEDVFESVHYVIGMAEKMRIFDRSYQSTLRNLRRSIDDAVTNMTDDDIIKNKNLIEDTVNKYGKNPITDYADSVLITDQMHKNIVFNRQIGDTFRVTHISLRDNETPDKSLERIAAHFSSMVSASKDAEDIDALRYEEAKDNIKSSLRNIITEATALGNEARDVHAAILAIADEGLRSEMLKHYDSQAPKITSSDQEAFDSFKNAAENAIANVEAFTKSPKYDNALKLANSWQDMADLVPKINSSSLSNERKRELRDMSTVVKEKSNKKCRTIKKNILKEKPTEKSIQIYKDVIKAVQDSRMSDDWKKHGIFMFLSLVNVEQSKDWMSDSLKHVAEIEASTLDSVDIMPFNDEDESEFEEADEPQSKAEESAMDGLAKESKAEEAEEPESEHEEAEEPESKAEEDALDAAEKGEFLTEEEAERAEEKAEAEGDKEAEAKADKAEEKLDEPESDEEKLDKDDDKDEDDE